MVKLVLPLKSEYFDAIRDGAKTEEYRLINDYWTGRLVGKTFDGVILTKGYPRSDDHSRRIELPWRGFRTTTITHKHFGPRPVAVFAIDVSRRPS